MLSHALRSSLYTRVNSSSCQLVARLSLRTASDTRWPCSHSLASTINLTPLTCLLPASCLRTQRLAHCCCSCTNRPRQGAAVVLDRVRRMDIVRVCGRGSQADASSGMQSKALAGVPRRQTESGGEAHMLSCRRCACLHACPVSGRRLQLCRRRSHS